MSNIIQDVGKVWCRLFDHKGFVGGEINFTLVEFEQKRGEKEVDNLFNIIENITDIKETQVNKISDSINSTLPETYRDIQEALDLCSRFFDLEERYKQDSTIEEERQKRKANLEKFMENITSQYYQIDSSFETKRQDLSNYYKELENKLN